MKVIIVQSFTGYPDKPDVGQEFVAGPEAVEVPDEFGALIIKKGHATPADAAPVRSEFTESSHGA